MELRKTVGASGIQLDALSNEDNAFRDYGNNQLKLIGTMAVTLESNGLENEREDKSHRRKSPIYNRKGPDASTRITVGAKNTRGPDNVH